MSLKTSYFNLPFFKSNLKRFWWIGAGMLLAFLSISLLMLFNTFNADGFVIMNVVSIIVAGLLPTILFSYLNSSGAVTCTHAFPVKRKAYFITNIVTIFALIIIPAIIAYVIGLGYCLIADLPTQIDNILEYFVVLVMVVTISASMGTLGAMITGNSIASIAFTMIFLGLPFYSEVILDSFLQMNVYGMWQYDSYTLSNLSVFEVNTFMTVYFIISVLVYIISWLLYKSRKLETNGDIISFKFLKPVFMACVAVFSGFIGYFYLDIFFDENIFLMLPFGIIGVLVSYMLSKKAFTFRGVWKPVLTYVLCVIAFWGIIEFDLTGYERRVPKVSDIASIDLMDRYRIERYENQNSYTIMDGQKFYYTDPVKIEDFRYTDEKDFENITNLHRHLIKDRLDEGELVSIRYNLKNGGTIKRRYWASLTEDKEFLEPVYLTEQYKKSRHEWLVKKLPVLTVFIEDERMKGGNDVIESISGESKKAKLLIDALLQDLDEATYEDIASYSNSPTVLKITYSIAVKADDAKEIQNFSDKQFTNQDTFGIPESYKRTTALLQEWGMFNDIIQPEDIKTAGVFFNYNSEDEEKTTDTTVIKELYNYVYLLKHMYSTKDYLGNNIHDLEIRFYDDNGDVLDFVSTYRLSGEKPPQFVIDKATEFLRKKGYDSNVIELRQTAETAEVY